MRCIPVLRLRTLKNLFLLALSATTAWLASYQMVGQFVSYNQLEPLLSSTALAEHVEYVAMSHPGFECICSWLDFRVMSVKLSDNQTEQYVFVPNSQWNEVLGKLESRQISIIAID